SRIGDAEAFDTSHPTCFGPLSFIFHHACLQSRLKVRRRLLAVGNPLLCQGPLFIFWCAESLPSCGGPWHPNLCLGLPTSPVGRFGFCGSTLSDNMRRIGVCRAERRGAVLTFQSEAFPYVSAGCQFRGCGGAVLAGAIGPGSSPEITLCLGSRTTSTYRGKDSSQPAVPRHQNTPVKMRRR